MLKKLVHINRCEWKELCYSTDPIRSTLPQHFIHKSLFDGLTTDNLIGFSFNIIESKDLKTTKVTNEFVIQN